MLELHCGHLILEANFEELVLVCAYGQHSSQPIKPL